MAATIRCLKDASGANDIYPVTVGDAVFMSDDTKLTTKLASKLDDSKRIADLTTLKATTSAGYVADAKTVVEAYKEYVK